MEMRLLTTEFECRSFAERVAEARARHGGIFREVSGLRFDNRARLSSASLYALFENESDPAERMIAGIAMHNLKIFPQSCSKPDLAYLPPQSVLECSDHWSLSKGAGMRAWHGAAIQVVRLQACAVLAYLAVGSSDHMGFYAAMGFVKAGEPVEYPYVEKLDGTRPQVQPVILEGRALQKLTAGVSGLSVATLDNHRVIRFTNSVRLRPCLGRPALPQGQQAAVPIAVARGGGNVHEIAQRYTAALA
jgi:hypothetical protein